MQYIHTHREEWVLRFYERLKIFEPADIDMHYIAKRHRIYIKFWNKPASFDRIGNYKGINLPYGLSPEDERIQFFHELGHLVRQEGETTFMSPAYEQMQEWDANHFVFYAALPFHMLKEHDLDSKNVVTELSHIFTVPSWFVDKRLKFIQRKSCEYRLLMQGVN